MASTMIDSAFFKDLFGTDEMRLVFSDDGLCQCWLDAEAALARAEAKLGVIPAEAAAEISERAAVDLLDRAEMKRLVDETVHPLMPLIKAFEKVCRNGAGEYIHWGATTQDIMDTQVALQMKQAHALLIRDLSSMVDSLAALASKHRDTLMVGRTHGQHALPITFGFKVAVWLSEVLRHLERLHECQKRVVVGQFSGAVGTMAALGPIGLEVQELMMADLGLHVPVITWHTARDGIAEFMAVLGMIAATMGKIALEVILLQKSEVMEVEEPHNPGKIGSSTMPHKRNPMLCEAIVALSKLCREKVPVAIDCMVQQHERDMGPWQAEWAFVPDACNYAHAAVVLTNRVVSGLSVHPENMLRNLDALQGLILSEAVMMKLAPLLGRQTAHDVVYEAAMSAFEERVPLRQKLLLDPRVSTLVSVEVLDQILDPAAYVGLSPVFVDRVLAQAGRLEAKG